MRRGQLPRGPGRIIARATAHVSLDTLDAVGRQYGEAGIREIELSVVDTCRRLAIDFPR